MVEINIELGVLSQQISNRENWENVHYTEVINVFPVTAGSRAQVGPGSLLFHLIDYLYAYTVTTTNETIDPSQENNLRYLSCQ